jgi:hypothetical protein
MYISLANRGSALCNTTLRYEAVGYLKKAALRVMDEGGIGVDRYFWDSLPAGTKNIHRVNTVVGIKGLPGRKGLGAGHRPQVRGRRPWRVDVGLTVLKLWVGEDYLNYTETM